MKEGDVLLLYAKAERQHRSYISRKRGMEIEKERQNDEGLWNL